MRRIQLILLSLSMLVAIHLSAQHISLVENKGEIGVMGGISIYRGDIASDLLFYKPNFGVFYKKQLNDYVGIRLNYEYISLGANDIQSRNFYDSLRGLYFTRVSHDFSIMGEFNFLRLINKNRNYSFTPYLGFGFGVWKSIKGTHNIDNPTTQRTYLFPVNLGFKYNVIGDFNLFGEVTYRFTSSDKIDYFADDDLIISKGVLKFNVQPSASGKDQYFSSKLGISYNLISVYGPDKVKKEKNGRQKGNKDNSKFSGIFDFLKRK